MIFKKLAVIIAFLSLFIVGCGGDQYSSSIHNYAEYESEALEKTNAIADKTRDFYQQYNNGELNFEEFKEQLMPLRSQTKELRDDFETWWKDNKLSDADHETETYNNGLYYGQSLRLNTYSFLVEVTNLESEDKDKINSLYNTELVEGYTRKLDKLETALDQILK